MSVAAHDLEHRLFDLDPDRFRSCFGRKPFTISHRLTGDPRFELEPLVGLAQRLPAHLVEWSSGDGFSPNGLSAAETVRRIADCGSWLVLKNVERDPEYGALLDRCLGELGALSETVDPGMRMREGFVFVSSPGAITRYHIDPEHNFLLQIRGTKTITVFGPENVSEPELETFYRGGGRNLDWRDELASRGVPFTLGPGDGLHVPITNPHWVRNGPAVSVSFSVTWRTPTADAREALYKVNGAMRRFVTPSPVGRKPARDAVKLAAVEAVRRLKRLL